MIIAAEQANGIINFIALGLSILAIIISLIGLWFRQKFYKKSLKPLINIGQTRDFPNSELVPRLKNKGVGPAVIKKLFIKIDGKKYSEFHKTDFRNTLRDKVMSTTNLDPDNFNYEIDVSGFFDGHVLSSNETQFIFKFGVESDLANTGLFKDLSGIEIFCEYESVYNTSYSVEEKLRKID